MSTFAHRHGLDYQEKVRVTRGSDLADTSKEKEKGKEWCMLGPSEWQMKPDKRAKLKPKSTKEELVRRDREKRQ
ncbi:hypothetical protein NDU88_007475 [Pleurodeles waltl]|uniref:Uncharacterized protein n=1 Tax=Pleurodeles waltl TaxID=8319 RepID=A0AAV7U3S5_PLEWA|nr:hypothetical protein NDU88_007475 [Pleurodeles waltl]